MARVGRARVGRAHSEAAARAGQPEDLVFLKALVREDSRIVTGSTRRTRSLLHSRFLALVRAAGTLLNARAVSSAASARATAFRHWAAGSVTAFTEFPTSHIIISST